jgi:hypothetical protein
MRNCFTTQKHKHVCFYKRFIYKQLKTKKMQKHAKNNKNAAKKVSAKNANLQTISTEQLNAAQSEALAVNTIFNAVNAANPLQNSVLTVQQSAALAATATAVKAATKVKKVYVKKERKQIAYIVFLSNLIAAAQYTAKQLSAMCAEQFADVKLSTINTTLTDAKNAKYTRFAQIAVCDKVTKILSFAAAAETATN